MFNPGTKYNRPLVLTPVSRLKDEGATCLLQLSRKQGDPDPSGILVAVREELGWRLAEPEEFGPIEREGEGVDEVVRLRAPVISAPVSTEPVALSGDLQQAWGAVGQALARAQEDMILELLRAMGPTTSGYRKFSDLFNRELATVRGKKMASWVAAIVHADQDADYNAHFQRMVSLHNIDMCTTEILTPNDRQMFVADAWPLVWGMWKTGPVTVTEEGPSRDRALVGTVDVRAVVLVRRCKLGILQWDSEGSE